MNGNSLSAPANKGIEGPAPSNFLTLGQSYPGSVKVIAWVILALAVIASVVLAYYCWFEWLPRLWNWGFKPPTWRGIFSVIGGMYLIIGPAMPVAAWGQAFVPLLISAAKPGTKQRELAAVVRTPRSRARLRLALVIFIAVPLLIALVALAFYLSVAQNQLTLRWMFLVIVILLPAVLYYLFNVSRRYGVLTDLLSNLNRFGLLTPITDEEQEAVRQRRVLGYIRKFEATYGPLPEKDLQEVVESASLTDPMEPLGGAGETNALSDVLTETRIPVFIATALIAIGWATALPPFEFVEKEVVTLTENQAHRVTSAESTAAPDAVDVGDSTSDKTAPNSETQGDSKNDTSTAKTDGPEYATSWDRQFTPKIELIGFAFLGAYFFSIQMLFRRYIRRDLSSSAYTSVSLRIILAVIGTWVMFEGIGVLDDVDPRYRLAIAFSVGLLPQIVIEALAQLGKKFFSTIRIMEGLTTSLPVTRLDGLTIWHATRLEEEDIEDVYGMATADVINLMIRTRFHPDRIVDWVDQALLYAQLSGMNQSVRGKLADAGIRTATGLLVSLNKNESEIKKIFASEQELARLKITGDVIRTKTNLQEILHWRGFQKASNEHPHKEESTILADIRNKFL